MRPSQKKYSIGDVSLKTLGIDVPTWIERDITVSTVTDIVQGGCASGAYMPACTYHTALTTMSEHGDDVLGYIDTEDVEIPPFPTPTSWAGMACHIMSCAIEIWASSVQSQLDLDSIDVYGMTPQEIIDWIADAAIAMDPITIRTLFKELR